MAGFAERYHAHVRLAVLLRLIEPPEVERRRLFLLRALAAAPGGALTASLLHEAAGEFAPAPPRDVVIGDLGWLAEQGLVAFEGGRVPGAVLLRRGRDVAAGRARAPGVAALPTVDWLQEGVRAVSLSVALRDLLDYVGWLETNRLVATVSEGGECLVLLTAFGRDVALGRDRCDGVKEVSHETVMRLAASSARSVLGS